MGGTLGENKGQLSCNKKAGKIGIISEILIKAKILVSEE